MTAKVIPLPQRTDEAREIARTLELCASLAKLLERLSEVLRAQEGGQA